MCTSKYKMWPSHGGWQLFLLLPIHHIISDGQERGVGWPRLLLDAHLDLLLHVVDKEGTGASSGALPSPGSWLGWEGGRLQSSVVGEAVLPGLLWQPGQSSESPGSPSFPSGWIFHTDSKVPVLTGTQVVAMAYTYSFAPPPFLGAEGGADDFMPLGGIWDLNTNKVGISAQLCGHASSDEMCQCFANVLPNWAGKTVIGQRKACDWPSGRKLRYGNVAFCLSPQMTTN